MSARAMWKASLQVGPHAVPVKLYSAIEDRAVHFRLLDARDETPVVQELVELGSDEPLPPDAARKGVELDEGVFVMLTPEELAGLEPEESRSISVERFVPPGAVEESWYDRPYWLGPDGATSSYFALVEALRAEERIGIAHWTMRKHRYHGALRVSGDHLLLVRLRHTEEVIPASALSAPTGRTADPKEVALAEQLVGALAGPFDPSELAGTYEQRVRELVEAKASGKLVTLHKARPKKATTSGLAAALGASLDALKRGRGQSADDGAGDKKRKVSHG
ncbi:MAG: Ku protein [Myxococcota bacterium]